MGKKSVTESRSRSTVVIPTIPSYGMEQDDVYSLVFVNYPALERKANTLAFSPKNGNVEKLKHVNFILQAGEKLHVDSLCPCCHKHQVKNIRIRDNRLIACCDNPHCRKCSSGELFPLSFNIFGHEAFQSNERQRQLKKFFAGILGLPENPPPECIYNALKRNLLLAPQN